MKRILFVFDRVAHYYRELFNILDQQLKANGTELHLLSGQKSENVVGRVGRKEAVVQHEAKFSFKKFRIGTYIFRIQSGVMEMTHELDPVYGYAMGDTDYALRSRVTGFGVYVAPVYVGHGTNNPVADTYCDQDQSPGIRWRKMVSCKGLLPRSWRHFRRRHGGPAWPVYFVWPYARLIAESLRNGLPGATRGQKGR